MIHTNRCKHCGKTKEEHYTPPPPNNTATYCTDGNENFDQFYDSGKANFDAALDARKEELYEEACEVVKQIKNLTGVSVAFPKLESILNQIGKEK